MRFRARMGSIEREEAGDILGAASEIRKDPGTWLCLHDHWEVWMWLDEEASRKNSLPPG
jgi:hypothetical protein